MEKPELYIVASCAKISKCTNHEAQELIKSGEDIFYVEQNDKLVEGYLIEYPNIKFWRKYIDDKYFKYTEVKDNPIAIKVFNYIKGKHISSTGVSK